MRLIESVCALTVLALFLGIAASALRPVRRLVRETERLSAAYERDRFLADDFTALCADGGRDRFSEWTHMCESLWDIEAIHIENKGWDSAQNALFSCTWKTADGERTVWALAKKE